MKIPDRAVLHIGLLAALMMLAGCSEQGKIDRHLAKGNEHYEAGRYEQATIEYLNVLREDRTNGVAIVRSALAHYELGNARESVALLNEAVKIEPENLELHLKLGTLLRLAGYVPESREQALEILDRDPDHFDGLMLLVDTAITPEELDEAEARLVERAEMYGDRPTYHLAMAQVSLRKRAPSEAEASLNRALEADPENVRVLDALAEFHDSLGNRELAHEYLEKAAQFADPVSNVQVKWQALQYAKGDKETATARLREMVAEEPNFIPAWVQLGNYALLEQRPDEVQEAVDAILEVNPNHYAGRMLRARLWLIQGETENAVEGLEQLLEQNPNSATLNHQLGIAYLSLGRVDQAKESLAKAVELDSRQVQAALKLAELNLRTGQGPRAVRDLESLIGDQGGSPQAVLLLARAYLATGESEQALASLRGLEEMQPESHLAPFLRGEILLQQKRNREARAAFELAQERAPDLVAITARLAVLDLRDEKPDAATARVKAAIEKAPEQAELHHMLGVIYAQTGREELAEQAFREEIKVNPTAMQAYLSLTKLLVQLDRVDEALAQVEDGLKVDPDNPQTLMLSGMFHEQIGDHAKAMERYERLIEVNPEFAQAYNNAAYMYSESLGELDRAYELAKKARELAPADPAIADTLGWIAYQRGEHRWALTLILESAEVHSDHPEVQYHVGMAQLAMGDEGKALSALTNAVQLAMGSEEVLKEIALAQALAELLSVPIDQVAPKHQGLIETVQSVDPENPAARIRQAALQESADPDAAKAVYQGIYASHPHYLPATLRLIDLHDNQFNDRAGALRLARDVRAEQPDNAEIARRAGWLAVREGEVAWGLNMLQESARALPELEEVAYQVAVATYLMGQVAEAEQRLETLTSEAAKSFLALVRGGAQPVPEPALVEQAEAVNGDDPARVPAGLILARAREAAGDPAAATATLNTLLEQVPTFAPAAAEAARIYADALDDPDKALPLATQAREALPDDANVARLLGRLMYGREDYAYAVRLLEQGVATDADHAESQYLLGLSRQQLGDASGAREALEKALALDPESPHAAAANEILNPPE